jgi:uncharacterized protein involved in outer membrane biogenesis
VQHALLGLAIAFILAIAAALAAPAYVNWSDWRAKFESHASTLAGASVRIRGPIEATLLPTPAFVFRDVDIGDPENGTGVSVGEVRGVLSLGALLRGVFEAEEFVLVRPAMRIAADADKGAGAAALRAAASATGVVALSRISVERGSLVFDRDGELTILDDIYAEGEMRARQGPMRIDAVFRRDGRRWGLRANAGQFSGEGAGRVRLTLEHAGAGTLFDAEGMLSLAGAAPRFDGKLMAARRSAPGVPWQITAQARASEESVALESFELSLGADAAPADLVGRIEFEPRRGGKLEGSLSARRIDLDLTAGGETAKGLPASFASLREVLALMDGLPLQGRIGLAVENLIAAGGTLRDIEAELGVRENSLALERIEAKLPGRGSLTASGAKAGDALFAGDAALEAEDAAAFARWAFGDKSAPLENSGALRIAGKVDWRGGRFEASELRVALGEAKFGGDFALEPGAAGKRTRIESHVTANGVDLDLLAPVAEWLSANSGAADIALGVQGNSLRVLGHPLGRIDAALSRSAKAVAIERLVIDDFDGLSLTASGRIAAPIERPSGKIEFDLSTTRPDGLARIAQKVFGQESARLVRHIAGSGSPLKLSGSATGAGSAAGVEINAEGKLGDLDAMIAANFDLLTESLSEGHVTLEAREPGWLAVLFGLSPGLPAAGSGLLEIDVSTPEKGVLPLSARLSVPGTEIAAEGSLRNGDGGRIEPDLKIKIDASNLRPLLAVAAQTSGNATIEASGNLRLTRSSEAFALEDIALKIGGAEIKGGLTASALDQPVLGGQLSVERMEIATLLALALGHARDGRDFWPATRFGPAPLAGSTGTIDFDVATLAFAGPVTAEQSKFRLRLGPAIAAIENFTGELASGRLAGQASFVRGQIFSFDGRASLEGFDIARLIAPDGNPEIRGRGQMTLTLAGSGATPAAIASSLAGQGSIVLEELEIDGADPRAVASVFAADDQAEARDEIAVIAALAPALAKGPLRIARIEAPIVAASGNLRSVKARTNVGETQVSAEANLDIAKLMLDASVEMEIAPASGSTVRPAATVRWRGPLAAPERGIEAAALATAITLRAMERETKRIEERDRALPPLQPRPEQPAQPERSERPAETNPLASIPSIVPPDPAAPPISIEPAPSVRPRVIEPPRSALPPLPPAMDIRPAPSIYPPDPN